MPVYRALLYIYPRSFRHEYGDEMEGIFRARRRQASGLAVLALWAETVTDTLLDGARVHWDQLREDVRYSWRSLAHARGFAVTAVIVAALGTGATTTTFSVADHVLVRPLPFPDSDQLVMVWQDQRARGYSRIELSVGNYLDLKTRNRSLAGLAAYTSRPVNLVGHGNPERLDASLVTPDLFGVLGAQAARGRALMTADGEPGAADTVVLSHATWRTTFAADPNVLGRTIALDGTPHVVVGVMPRGFEFPTRETDLWLAFRLAPDDDRANLYLRSVGRLAPRVSIEQARGDLVSIAAQLEQEHPVANAETSATVHLLRDQVSPQTRTMLLTLVAASLCLLLIACFNMANLLLARALTRQREIAIRLAMGVGWERLTRQLMTESLLIALTGGVAGVILALTATPLVAQLVPTALPIPDAPGADLRILAIAALVVLATTVGFGAMPAIRATRQADAASLRDGTRTGTTRANDRWRTALVVAEISATVVLLVCAGLLTRALWNVQAIDPGFRADNVLTARTALPFPKYAPTERRQQFYDRVLDEVRALPGVTGAAYASFLPMVMRGGIWPITLGGADDPEAGTVSLRLVTPGYFDTMGIALRRGRDLAANDTMQAPFVAVVSESFANRHWPGQNPVGRRFFVAFFERTVVGVAGDVRVRGLERDSEPQVYVPSRQVPDGGLMFYAPKDLVVRASVPVASLTQSVRHIVSAADPEQPLSDVRLLSDIVAGDAAGRRAQLFVILGFAAVAFALAAFGVHGLLSFTVSSQTRDIGVRMALGAPPWSILGSVLGRGLILSAVGLVAGVMMAAGAGRLLQSLLAGVNPADPGVFGAAGILVIAMTVGGALLPARRASRIDPIAAIRTE
jgi:putative ABC transport system permease protein